MGISTVTSLDVGAQVNPNLLRNVFFDDDVKLRFGAKSADTNQSFGDIYYDSASNEVRFDSTRSGAGVSRDIVFRTGNAPTVAVRITPTGKMIVGIDTNSNATSERITSVVFDALAGQHLVGEFFVSWAGNFSGIGIFGGNPSGLIGSQIAHIGTYGNMRISKGASYIDLDGSQAYINGQCTPIPGGGGPSAAIPNIRFGPSIQTGIYGDNANVAVSVNSTFLNNFAAASGYKSFVRNQDQQGADIASANDLTLGADGNSFEITGATTINAITTTNWQNGAVVTLLFTSTPTVKNNTAGGAGTAVILLALSVDFIATAGDTLTLRLSEIGGTQAWREIARTII